MQLQTNARIPSSQKLGFPTKTALFASVGASALVMASSAYAQEAAAPQIESVTVSSSRIMTGGFNAPTPTTVVSADLIQNQAKDNIFSAITELPSMMGSTGQEANVNGTSGGTNGLSSFNLFGLGTIRTLTLMDGERFVPANVTGVPDISEFPQLLIQRVDVVTGGASASWGSDAVAGVVNFVTDKKFVGFKANVEAGLSTYSDNATATFQAAAGSSFAGGRGHFEVAGEFSHVDGVQGGWQQLSCCGGNLQNSLSGGRTWFIEPTIVQYASPATTPAGQPQYFVTANGQQNQLGRYGLINSGPLMGTAFGPNGTTYAFNYGTGPAGVNIATGLGGTAQGVAAKNGSAGTPGTVNNCIVAFCIGGENDGQTGSGVTLASPQTRGDVYARMSYDLSPNTEVYLTYNWSQVGTSNIPNPDMWLGSLPGISGGSTQSNTAATSLTSSVLSNSAFNPGQLLQAPGIQCGNAAGGANAFLPASVQAACIANGITSFSLGSLYYGLGPQEVYTQRDNRRLVGGADGTFNLFSTDWTWKGYYEHGENDTNIHVRGIALKPYLYAAIDSVQVTAANQATYGSSPLGSIVCRSAVADAEGCVPFDPFGAPVSQGQKNWLYGGNNWGPGPIQISHQMQDVADFVISGAPIEDWAGKISVATGGTWRQEAYDVRGDGAGNGTIGGSGGAPGSACNDPLLNCLNGTNWYAGSFHNGQGDYHVLEGFVELNVPLINTPDWGSANLNIAGRHARYSTAGDLQYLEGGPGLGHAAGWRASARPSVPRCPRPQPQRTVRRSDDGQRFQHRPSEWPEHPGHSGYLRQPAAEDGTGDQHPGGLCRAAQLAAGLAVLTRLLPHLCGGRDPKRAAADQRQQLPYRQLAPVLLRHHHGGGHHAADASAAVAAGQHPVLQRGIDRHRRLQPGNLLSVQSRRLGLYAYPRRLHGSGACHLCGQVHHRFEERWRLCYQHRRLQ